MPFSEREEAAFTIEGALRRLIPGKLKRAIDGELRLAAEKILAHLEQCRFTVRKLPPPPSDAHKTFGRYNKGWPDGSE